MLISTIHSALANSVVGHQLVELVNSTHVSVVLLHHDRLLYLLNSAWNMLCPPTLGHHGIIMDVTQHVDCRLSIHFRASIPFPTSLLLPLPSSTYLLSHLLAFFVCPLGLSHRLQT